MIYTVRMNKRVETVSSAPIGIFDSGMGGLTVAKSIVNTLPNENLIYFGDTLHLPYGDKSRNAIESYSLRICDFLIERNCKLIMVACNSASAAAFETIKQHVKNIPLLNVIDPIIHFFKENAQYNKIGLIATRQTVSSNAYQSKFKEAGIKVDLKALAAPLLVPLIEFGYCRSHVMDTVIKDYLSSEAISDIDALILGCTHYPLVKDKIRHFYLNRKKPTNIKLVDSTHLIPETIHVLLKSHNLINPVGPSHQKFFVSDYTDAFEETAKLFFGNSITLEHYPLWG